MQDFCFENLNFIKYFNNDTQQLFNTPCYKTVYTTILYIKVFIQKVLQIFNICKPSKSQRSKEKKHV